MQPMAQGKCEHRRFGKSELARSDEDDALVEAVRGEHLLHAAEAHLERERDVIGEDQRPGAGAAFTAIDGDEIHAARAARHRSRQVLPDIRVHDRDLIPTGSPVSLAIHSTSSSISSAFRNA
jgi:hypothetical protein